MLLTHLSVQAEPVGDVPALQPQLCLPCSAQGVLPNKAGAETVKPDFCNQGLFLKPPASLRMSQLLAVRMCSVSRPVLLVKPCWEMMSTPHRPRQLLQLRQNRWRLPSLGTSCSPGSRHQVYVKLAD